MKTKTKKPRAKVQRRSNLRTPDAWLRDILVGESSTSGMTVTEATALNAVVVYACVRNLSEDIAKLPLFLYRRLKPRGKERATELPLYRILHDSPNDEMTSFDFRQAMMVDVLLGGNAYAIIMRSNGGDVIGLRKVDRNRVTPRRLDDSSLVYIIKNSNMEDSVLPASEVFHIKAMGDGLVGWSIIKFARESIGLALAAENSGSSFFGNSSLPSGVLETPQKMNDQAVKNLRESWERLHMGEKNRHKIAILEQGMKFNAMTINPDDAQFLETRQFQVEDVARWWRMPPHKIGNLQRATGWSTLESTNTDYVVDTLMPWTERWDQEIQRKLLTRPEQANLFVEHEFKGLLKGDATARKDFYMGMIGIGAMSPNDVREAENLNPIDDEDKNGDNLGDNYFISTQYQTLDAAVNVVDTPPPNPTPAAPPALPDPNAADMQRKLDSVHYHHRAMLKDAFSRILTLEMDKIQRMSGKPDFETAAAKFYQDHGFYVRDAVSSIFTSYAASAWAILSDNAANEQQREKIVGEIVEICNEHAKKSQAECRNAEAVAGWKTRAETQAHDTLTRVESLLKSLAKGGK